MGNKAHGNGEMWRSMVSDGESLASSKGWGEGPHTSRGDLCGCDPSAVSVRCPHMKGKKQRNQDEMNRYEDEIP